MLFSYWFYPCSSVSIRGSSFGGLLYSRPAIAGADTPSIRLARSISSIGLAPKSRLNSRLNWEELAVL